MGQIQIHLGEYNLPCNNRICSNVIYKNLKLRNNYLYSHSIFMLKDLAYTYYAKNLAFSGQGGFLKFS